MPVPSPDERGGLNVGLTAPLHKNHIVTEASTENSRTDLTVDETGMSRISDWKKPLKLASWNVRSLYRAGCAQTLERELLEYGIEIAALQEVRWPGTGKCDLEKGAITYSGREDGLHQEGVGFYLSKRAMGAVEEFEAISSRIAKLRLDTKWFKVTIVSAYAPTEISDDQEKDNWYDQLQSVLDRIPGHDMLLLLGDFNAKVGREVNTFQPAIGIHSLHALSNDNGMRLATLAIQYGLVIGGTVFPHKDIHKGTWTSPDGNTTNQIDHVLVKRKFRKSLSDVRVFRSADCDTDHSLLMTKIQIKLSSRRSRIPKAEIIDTEKLRDTEFRNQYQVEVENRFQVLEDENTDIEWSEVCKTVTDAGKEKLGLKRKNPKNEWFDADCMVTAERRKTLSYEVAGGSK